MALLRISSKKKGYTDIPNKGSFNGENDDETLDSRYILVSCQTLLYHVYKLYFLLTWCYSSICQDTSQYFGGPLLGVFMFEDVTLYPWLAIENDPSMDMIAVVILEQGEVIKIFGDSSGTSENFRWD